MKKFFIAAIFFLLSCDMGSKKPLGPYPPPEMGPYAIQGLIKPADHPATPSENDGSFSPMPQNSGNPSAEISGSIRLDPKLTNSLKMGKNVLFIIVRSPQGGPPLAVKRLIVDHFPVSFSIGNADAMTPGRTIEGNVQLIARIDADGSAGPVQPGDMEGVFPKPVSLGQKNLEILINKLY